jgi:hypothetical protein
MEKVFLVHQAFILHGSSMVGADAKCGTKGKASGT